MIDRRLFITLFAALVSVVMVVEIGIFLGLLLAGYTR